MIIHLFAIMKNEADLLPYFLRHYETFVDKIFLFDNHSTDDSRVIASSGPRVVSLEYEAEYGDEHQMNAFYEDAYKQYSRGVADWAIIADIDEFLYHPDIKHVLANQAQKDRQLVKATGYTMYSEDFVTNNKQIYENYQMGYRTTLYDKAVIFNPDTDIKFKMGRHKVPDWPKAYRCGIILLHYKYMSKDLTQKRMSSSNRNAPEDKWLWKKEVAQRRWTMGCRGELGDYIKVL